MRHFSLPGPVLASLGIITALTAAPVTAAASTSTGSALPTTMATALAQAFEAGRHIPGSVLGGIRPGTLHSGTVHSGTVHSGTVHTGTVHTGTGDGTEWAIASFTPSDSASEQAAAGFQDGAATGVFNKRGGAWRLVKTGPYGCGDGLPTALKTAWGLTDCAGPAAGQGTTAQGTTGPAAGQGTTAQGTAAQGTARTRTKDLDQAIASIALSQVGMSDTPAVSGFALDCDPYSTLTAGFSANSDGCGHDGTFNVENENETWCSDFNKWVWERAGVTVDMNALNAGSVSFYDWAQQQGEPLAPDTGTPAIGDSIVFFEPSLVGIYADHVGIVTSVNPDGTINMVNGDFLGSTNVHVEYDTEINLTSWATMWGPGEEWFIVTPPTARQQPTPTATMSGPRAAVTGTDSVFRAQGSERGGSISGYYWTFGDGRTTNATGPDVTHVYSEAGTYTASVTITSGFGTITTLTRNVSVLGSSSAIASVPSNSVWFATTPVDEYLFVRSAGGLAVDTWDGASWLRVAVPGQPSAVGGIAALSYPDPAADDAMAPHAYFRAADGSLAQTYLGTSGWVTRDLPGQPADDSGIVATTTADGPAVFYVDSAGRLAESGEQAGSWTTTTLVRDGPALSPASLALADTTRGPVLFGVGPAGTIRAVSDNRGTWVSRPIPAKTGTVGSLTALTTPGGRAAVVYIDVRGGRLAEAAETSGTTSGKWTVTSLPGSPAPGSSLAATTYPLPSAMTGPLGLEAFYLTPSGAPAVTFDDGTGWQNAALPGTGDAITGASAYPVAYQPMQLFLRTAAGGLTEDIASGAPSGAWTTRALPGTPATFAERVMLYAATPADDQAALSAATTAGLPAGQVTTSFATAWDDTLSGGYLVISVGLAATDALYYNVCGWANPSTDIPGSTPFYDVTGQWDTLPGADAFENGAASSAPLTQQRVTDLAYYAVHGTLPPGVTIVPAAVTPVYACSGSP